LDGKVLDSIRRASREKSHPDGTRYRTISAQAIASLAKRQHMPGREMEIAALKDRIIPERYARNLHSLTPADQVKLLEAHVAVVGLGGLGGTVAEALARIGVGTLTLIDGDGFDESNLNRQILSTEQNLSTSKAETAARRIGAVNSSVSVSAQAQKMKNDNAFMLLQGAKVAVDCLDTISARFLLESASKRLGIPLVSAAVGGHAGQLTTIFPDDKGFERIYGSQESAAIDTGAEARLGNLSFTVFTVASLEAAEVVKVLLDAPSNLRNRLLIIDLQDYTFERIQLK
jgi:molybdopterin/thiamine biosynthesis adenylyltransferase